MNEVSLTDVANRYQVSSSVIFDWVETRFLPWPARFVDGEPVWSEASLDAHDSAVWAGGGRPDGDKTFTTERQRTFRPRRQRTGSERLSQIAEIVESQDDDLGAWFREALEAWQQGDDLAAALELTEAARRARRDAAIRAAAEHLTITSLHGKAERLRLWCEYVKTNRKRPTRAPRKLEAHEAGTNEVERLMAAAIDTGLPMPKSTKQYERILSVGHAPGCVSKVDKVEADNSFVR